MIDQRSDASMEQHGLSLRPTVIAGDRLKDDYCVRFEGRTVGRIRLAVERTGHAVAWDWMLNPPLPIPSWGSGSAETLDEAKAAFRKAWAHFYESLTPTDIDHWHHIQDAREGRR